VFKWSAKERKASLFARKSLMGFSNGEGDKTVLASLLKKENFNNTRTTSSEPG
jgi:hypothetical protein